LYRGVWASDRTAASIRAWKFPGSARRAGSGAAAGWDEAGGWGEVGDWDGAGCATADSAPSTSRSRSRSGRHQEARGNLAPIVVKADTPRGLVRADYFFFFFDFVAFTIASHGV
jgi:hypothetical protein